MRKLLYIIGAVSVAIFVVVAVGVGILVHKGNALDSESKAFVDRAIPAIVSAWKPDQLLDRASDALRRNAPPDRVADMFGSLSRLGPLVRYEGSKGEATMSYFSGSGASVTALYVAIARFQNGRAIFRLFLVKQGGHWLIQNFHVDPAMSANSRHST